MYKYEPSLHRRRHNNVSGIVLGTALDDTFIKVPESTFSSHSLITGKSGSGKTSLLYSIVRGLIETKSNILLIDPHGSLTGSVLPNLAPDDLYYFSSSPVVIDGSKRSIRMNPLSSTEGGAVPVITGILRDLFALNEDFSHGTWGPRLEILIGNLLTGLAEEGKVQNLSEFTNLLMDRKRLLETMEMLSNRTLGTFIEKISSNQRDWLEYTSSALNKLVGLLSDKTISGYVSDDDTFRISDFLGGKGGLMTGEFSKGKISRSSLKIGSSLLLGKIWASLLQKPTERLYVIIDEAQELSYNLLYTLLNEGRKFGVSLILATQEFTSLDEKLKPAILSNVNNFFCFQQSLKSLNYFSEMFTVKLRPIVSSTLLSQQYYSFVMIDRNSVIVKPQSFKTMKMDPGNQQVASQRIAESVKRHGKEESQPSIFVTKGIDTHSVLLERFIIFSQNLGLKSLPIAVINGSKPDQIVSDNSQVFVCEIEISDLHGKERILKKLQAYKGKRKIFITQNGEGSELKAKILDFASREIFLPDLENISILERRNTRFYMLSGELLKLPKVGDFYVGSFLSAVAKPNRQFASYVLSYLRDHNFFKVDKSHIKCPEHFNRELFNDYISKEFGSMIDMNTVVSGK